MQRQGLYIIFRKYITLLVYTIYLTYPLYLYLTGIYISGISPKAIIISIAPRRLRVLTLTNS